MTGVATGIAAVTIGASVLQAGAQRGAVREATAAQERQGEREIEESRRQFDKLQEVLKPFVDPGTSAIGAQATLAGLGGRRETREAIEAIKEGPEFGALIETGEEAILQSASATGGLRGGNVQAALAQFRPQILSQLINQRFGRLGGIARLGQASAAGVGAGALQTGRQVGASLRNVGEVQAQGALGQGRISSQLFGDISRSLGTFAGNFDFGGGPNIGGGTGDPLGGLTIPGPADITGGTF